MDDENAGPRLRHVINGFDRNAARDLELVAEVDQADRVAGAQQGVAAQPGRLPKSSWASEQPGNGNIVERHEEFARGRYEYVKGGSLQRGNVTSPGRRQRRGYKRLVTPYSAAKYVHQALRLHAPF